MSRGQHIARADSRCGCQAKEELLTHRHATKTAPFVPHCGSAVNEDVLTGVDGCLGAAVVEGWRQCYGQNRLK